MAAEGSRAPFLGPSPAVGFIIGLAATGAALSLDRRLATTSAFPEMCSLAMGTTVAAFLLARRWLPLAVAVAVTPLLLGMVTDVAAAEALVEAVSLTVGGVTTALLLRKRRPFDLLDSFVPFVGASVVGAGVGNAVARPPVLGEQSLSAFAGNWMSDAVGILLVGGFILALATGEDRETVPSRSGIALLGISFLLAFASVAFSDLPLLFIVGSAAVVAGIRFGLRAVMADNVAIAAGVAVGLAVDPGAVFAGMTVEVGMAVLRTKLAVFVVAGLAGAGLARDRERAITEAVAADSRYSEEVRARQDVGFLADLSRELEGQSTLAGQAARLAELVARRFRARVSVALDEGGKIFTVGDLEPLGGYAERIRRMPFLVGDARGELILELREPGSWEVDRLLAVETAARAGRILSQTRIREIEHEIAVRLQKGLMAGPEVCVDGVETAACYEAGDDLLEVGGDWYDVLELPGGLVALVVGDVVGHGVEAAAAMGRLRTALAALAPYADGPADLLLRLDTFALGDDDSDFATIVCAVLDPSTGLLRYASAGHPPILAVSPDGSASWLVEGRSQPICSAPVADRSEAAAVLEPGTMLVFYSDGLVEARDRPLDEGLEHLLTAVTALRSATLPEVCDHLLKEFGVDAARDDDVVILCVRYLPSCVEVG